MLCPRCHDAFLDEVEREGVILDVCRKCRGLWLDRGELERLRAARPHDVVEPQGPRFEVRRDPPRPAPEEPEDDRRPRRKKASSSSSATSSTDAVAAGQGLHVTMRCPCSSAEPLCLS
jgi:Zn-finger nucleic acid-binding protein